MRVALSMLLVAALCAAAGTAAQAPAESQRAARTPSIPPLPSESARTQRYTIDARVSDDLARIVATSRIEFANPSPGNVDSLQFHLYWNAWKNTNSTWMRESAGGMTRRADRRVRGDRFGAIEVRSLRLVARGPRGKDGPPRLPAAVDLHSAATFLAPDDGNLDDETVLAVPLVEPLRAGESLALDVEFECTVPRIVARTGRKDDFLLVAHFYPQLGVYEERRDGSWGWNCHQFHAATEFFGEYATYDVTLTLPAAYDGKVGATGSLVEGPTRIDERVRYRFQQNDVHAFAFAADPRFVVVKRRFDADEAERDPKYAAEAEHVRAATGLTKEELRLQNVDVTLLLQPEHADQAERHFRAVREGLRWYGLWFGRYPYPTLTVVDPRYGSGAGGMEYPTLFTAGTRVKPSRRTFTPEGVTIHEFGHQHFYGLVGTNEFEHAWLDEGFNTYATARTLALAYGEEWTHTRFGPREIEGRPVLRAEESPTGLGRLLTLSAFARPVLREEAGFAILPDDPAARWIRELPFLNYAPERRPPVEALRASYLSRGYGSDRLDRESFRQLDGIAVTHNAYHKPATLLTSLERMLGPERWTRVLRAYTSRYRFRHPRPQDFFDILYEYGSQEIHGAPLSDFVRQTFGGSGRLDYGVASARSAELAEARGYFGQGADRKLVTSAEGTPADPKDTKKLYTSEFVVRRYGDVAWPVTVEWKREGESPHRESWDGVERWWRRVLPAGPKLEWVRVDPDRVLLLDDDWTNNDYRLALDARPALRWALRALLQAQTHLFFYGSLR